MNDRQREQALVSAAKKLAKLFSCATSASDQTLVVCASDGLEFLTNEELLMLQVQITAQLTRNISAPEPVRAPKPEQPKPEQPKPEPTPAPAPAHKPEPEPEPEPEPKPEPVFHRDPVGFYILKGDIESYKAVALLDSQELRRLHRLYGGKGKYSQSTAPAAIIQGVRKEANRGLVFAKPDEPTKNQQVEEKPTKPAESTNWLDLFGEL